jgi:hypothetical protein
MTFPDDRTMLSLCMLDNASEGKSTPDGRQFASVQVRDDRMQLWQIDPAEIETLLRGLGVAPANRPKAGEPIAWRRRGEKKAAAPAKK